MDNSIRFYTEYIKGLMDFSPSFRNLMEQISWGRLVDYEVREAAREEVKMFNQKNNYDVFMTHGAYRYCMIANNCDYVLKFSWDSDGGEDGCEIEMEVYEDAYKCGFADFFAKPYKLGPIENNHFKTCDFYLMEKAEVDEDRITEYCSDPHYKRLYTTLKDREKDLEYMIEVFEENDTVEVFVDYYINQLELLEDFIDFVDGIGLVDLHENNIGFIGDRPVIIDYAFMKGSREYSY